LKSKLFKSQGFKNSFWSFLSAGSYPVLVLIATPLFLTKLGDKQYGVWVLVNTILQLMSSVNFGLGDSSIKFISESQAKEENQHTNQIVSLMLTLSLLVASLFLASLPCIC
jgi:O-antigen/teichoic acid export membrane protein